MRHCTFFFFFLSKRWYTRNDTKSCFYPDQGRQTSANFVFIVSSEFKLNYLPFLFFLLFCVPNSFLWPSHNERRWRGADDAHQLLWPNLVGFCPIWSLTSMKWRLPFCCRKVSYNSWVNKNSWESNMDGLLIEFFNLSQWRWEIFVCVSWSAVCSIFHLATR